MSRLPPSRELRKAAMVLSEAVSRGLNVSPESWVGAQARLVLEVGRLLVGTQEVDDVAVLLVGDPGLALDQRQVGGEDLYLHVGAVDVAGPRHLRGRRAVRALTNGPNAGTGAALNSR